METHTAVTVNIWMTNSWCTSKCNLGWFDGIVCREKNCPEEHTTLIWAVIRSHNCGLPMMRITPNWTCCTHKAPEVLGDRGLSWELEVDQCGWSTESDWGREGTWGVGRGPVTVGPCRHCSGEPAQDFKLGRDMSAVGIERSQAAGSTCPGCPHRERGWVPE